MKRAALTVCLLVMVPLFARGDAFINRLKVDLQLVSPPEVEHRHQVNWQVKSPPVNRWLMIKVEFSVDKEKSSPKYHAGKMIFPGFADDVTLGVRVLFDTGFKIEKRSIRCLYDGRTEFYPLRRDGKRHLAVMFIPAVLIDRFSLSADGSIRKAEEKSFIAEVVFSRAGKVIDRAYCNISGRKAFDNECRGVPENLRIVGGVFPRSRTPWALAGADNLDLEKDLTPGRD